MKKINIILISLLFLSMHTSIAFSEGRDILSGEEKLWLGQRNNTIIIFPEKNYPPFSYENTAGMPQGLSVDFIELIAKKLDIKVEYLPARPLRQILDNIKNEKKGDIITSLADTKEREEFLYFTDSYITIDAVIVARKDVDIDKNLTLKDLSGKKVAIGSKYAVESFVRESNPRVVVEPVVDDESGLQQLVLGEVDFAIMDIASLSHYLSKQVLNSVKIVGDSGYDYKLAFAVPKNKEILQSILDKGLSQISSGDRDIIVGRWIVLPTENTKDSASYFLALAKDNITYIVLYLILGLFLAVIIIIIIDRKYSRRGYFAFRKMHDVEELKKEFSELENESDILTHELLEVRAEEEKLKQKIQSIKSEDM